VSPLVSRIPMMGRLESSLVARGRWTEVQLVALGIGGLRFGTL
jgi:hypothetical protein